MKNIKGFNQFINENSDLKIVKTVDEVIKFYTDPKPNLFGTGTMGQDRWEMSRNSFYDMASGGIGGVSGEEGENNIRDEIYNGWEDSDFQKVIDAVEGSKGSEESMESKESPMLSDEEKESLQDEIKNLKGMDVSFGEVGPLGKDASFIEVKVGNQSFDIIKDISDGLKYRVDPHSPEIKKRHAEDIEEVAYYISLWV